MTIRQRRTRKRVTPPGAWLAFLALAIQVLAPIFIADETALASTRAHTDSTTVICSASGRTTVPVQQDGSHHNHHGLLDGCPICTALAAGQAFTPALPLPLPRPQAEAVLFLP